MATESKQSVHGVRTYRGRTLEEILPQIREELGPEAIILREREGLVGGVGGFFAQRFIEVEARRGDGQSIDIYDDSPDDDLGAHLVGEEPTVTDRRSADGPEGGDPADGSEAAEPSPESEAHGLEQRVPPSQPRPFIPPSIERERPQLRAAPEPAPPVSPPPAATPRPESPAPARRAFETDVFMERLRAASQTLPDEDEDEIDLSSAHTAAAEQPRPAPARGPEVAPDADDAAEPEAVAEPVVEPVVEPPAQPTRPPRAPRTAQTPKTRPERKPRAAPARKPRTAAPRARSVQPSAEASAPAAPAEPELQREAPAPRDHAPNPYETLRQRPPSLRAGLPTAGPAATAGFSAPVPGARFSAPVPGASVTPLPGAATAVPPPPRPLEIQERRHGLIRDTLARLFGRRLGHAGVPRPSPPRPIDTIAAAAIATDLGTRGASQTFTAELISTVGAHGSPLAGSLRAAAEAEVARRIVPAPTLPATGASVAFIGAGGSGKTRCTAALASAYSRASTLGVTVISLDDPEGARELGRLLSGDGVPVLSLSGERAARAVAEARQGGFVIIDTPTATPTDAAAVQALGVMLEPLQLDAKFVTLPATLGAQAARRALAGLGALNPSAVAVTHADETDQLAVIVEIAIAHRIPLAYVNAGTDHHGSLSAVNATDLAHQLLPS